MFANIPLDVQVEIIKRVPVKSLIRFRSVSKQWKSLIDSPEFITDHRVNQTQPHHLLVMHCRASVFNYVSIVDDDNFPHHKFSPTVSPNVNLIRFPTILGCSHGGLVCLVASRRRFIVLWNPSIRKSIGIVLPGGVYALGFGVCPKTFDPKIVRIAYTFRYEAAVFTLTSGAWRSISMNLRLPHESMHFSGNPVVIDGLIHWLVLDLITHNYQIISFDLESEAFGEVVLPYSLACRKSLSISAFKESLAVLDYYYRGEGDAGHPFCDVWMMSKNGVPKYSFSKLFTLKDVGVNSIIGFTKNGQPMHGSLSELEVYEPDSDNMNGLGIHGSLFKMASYTESLLLLNQSDSIIE